MTETAHACLVLGTVNAKTNGAQLQTDELAALPSAVVNEIGADKQQKYFSFICWKDEKDQLYEALRPYGFVSVTLGETKRNTGRTDSVLRRADHSAGAGNPGRRTETGCSERSKTGYRIPI